MIKIRNCASITFGLAFLRHVNEFGSESGTQMGPRIVRQSIQNRYKFWVRKKRLSNRIKIGFGYVWDSILEGFEGLLGLSWALLGASWSFFGRSKSSFFKALPQDDLQDASWSDFGSILIDFGWILARFRMGLGMVWGRIWKDL